MIRKTCSLFLCFIMLLCLLSACGGNNSAQTERETERRDIESSDIKENNDTITTAIPIASDKQVVSLKNPTLESDYSMIAEQKATWDCIWFGEYPMVEIIAEDSPSFMKPQSGLWNMDEHYIQDADLYERLQNTDDWDDNQDTIIDGVKYRRMISQIISYGQVKKENCYYFQYKPIKWRVLSIQNGKAFLLSDQVLDQHQYHNQDVKIPWERSTMRSWLNGYGADSNDGDEDYSIRNFIDCAFTESEQSSICETEIETTSKDKIFLLSPYDVCNAYDSGETAKRYGFAVKYSVCDEAKRMKNTPYAFAHFLNSTEYSPWYLRSVETDTAYAVSGDGNFVHNYIDGPDAVRGCCPALYLNVETASWSYAGTVCSNGEIYEVNPDGTDNSMTEANTFSVDQSYIKNHKLGLGLDNICVVNKEGTIVNLEWYNFKELEEGKNNTTSLGSGYFHIAGLQKDGTVYVKDHDDYMNPPSDSWHDIVSLSAFGHLTAGLKSDGTVVLWGETNDSTDKALLWKNIVSINVGSSGGVTGLNSDGMVLSTLQLGYVFSEKVKAVVGDYYIVGLKEDGTVICNNEDVNNSVSEWRDIDTVYAYSTTVIGIKKDGTVIFNGKKPGAYPYRGVEKWTDIIDIAVNEYGIAGLKNDGSIVAIGEKSFMKKLDEAIAKYNLSLDVSSSETENTMEDTGSENPKRESSVENESDQKQKKLTEEGIIFPDSSTEKISQEVIQRLSDEELRYAINEIHARKGYIFNSDELREYYEQYDWYEKRVKADDFTDKLFNDVELQNVKALAAEREKRKR